MFSLHVMIGDTVMGSIFDVGYTFGAHCIYYFIYILLALFKYYHE
jgi:hypothetical protein